VIFNTYALGSNAEISASDTLGQMLGKIQAQIKNMGNGGSGFNWINADQISGLTLTAPVQHRSLKFAKKDGMLWICGCLYVQGTTLGSTKFFNISNAAYMVEQHLTNILELSHKLQYAMLIFTGLIQVMLRLTQIHWQCFMC
jgi:hypothetical protein